jgi:site-specific DNA-methyltransferase (adenine-specific)
MIEVEDESVQLIITSPEYYGASMWEHNMSFEEYINNLNEVWKECFRILKPDGKLVINVADISTSTKYYGRRKIYPTHSKIIENCEEIGFDYYDFLIWYKPHREFKKIYGSYPYPTNYQFFMVFEYILIFRKWVNEEYFRKRKSPPEEIKTESKISEKDWIAWSSNVWEISPVIKFNHKGKNLRKHIAPFPEEIPHRLVKVFSFQQDIVLDPFIGSGTVAIAANKLGRHYIGYEINKEYYDLCNKNILRMSLR